MLTQRAACAHRSELLCRARLRPAGLHEVQVLLDALERRRGPQVAVADVRPLVRLGHHRHHLRGRHAGFMSLAANLLICRMSVKHLSHGVICTLSAAQPLLLSASGAQPMPRTPGTELSCQTHTQGTSAAIQQDRARTCQCQQSHRGTRQEQSCVQRGAAQTLNPEQRGLQRQAGGAPRAPARARSPTTARAR